MTNQMNIYEPLRLCNMEISSNRLMENNEEEWKTMLYTKPKLHTYVTFKSKLETENYISSVHNRFDISLIAKLRCGILQLHVESGRFNNVPLGDRTCDICHKKIMKTRDRLYRRYKRTKVAEHFTTYTRVKNEVNSKIHRAKESHKLEIINKLEDLRTNPKKFWTIAKQVYGNKTRDSIPAIVDEGQQYCTSEQKANLLAKYFASQSQEPELIPGYSIPEEDGPKLLGELQISEDDVKDVIRKLQTNKAVGPDGISNRLLKMTCNSISRIKI